MNNAPFNVLLVVLSIRQILYYLVSSYRMRSKFLLHSTCVSKRSSRAWIHCCEIFHPYYFYAVTLVQVKLGVLMVNHMHWSWRKPPEGNAIDRNSLNLSCTRRGSCTWTTVRKPFASSWIPNWIAIHQKWWKIYVKLQLLLDFADPWYTWYFSWPEEGKKWEDGDLMLSCPR